MSMINKEVSDFKVQAYHNGEFKTVTKADVLGKWSVFFFYPASTLPGDTTLTVSFLSSTVPGSPGLPL